MKKLVLIIALTIPVFAGLSNCTIPEQEEKYVQNTSLTLMTWNMHNIFDGKDDGFEYAEFRSASGWSEEKYLNRIYSAAEAFSHLPSQPDIIMLQEIESLTILEDMASALSEDYLWCHFAGNYGQATGVGIISRYPLGETVVHSITIGNETSPRPVLEARLEDESCPFVIFVCHWKSKLGGDDETEHLRRASARVIIRRMRELWKQNPELGMLIAGDLNLNHDDFYRRGANTVTALMPDDAYTARYQHEQNDFFVLTGNKPPSPDYFSDENIVLYSPWMEDLENGSYYYVYTWETIDHFLLSDHFFYDTGWKFEQAQVFNQAPFANANGIPVGYNAQTGLGFSDHLPLLITFRRVDGR